MEHVTSDMEDHIKTCKKWRWEDMEDYNKMCYDRYGRPYWNNNDNNNNNEHNNHHRKNNFNTNKSATQLIKSATV